MPELPEVETVRRGLNRVTPGAKILGGDLLLDRTIAHPAPGEFIAALTGLTLVTWQRRGKYLLAELQSPATAASGLGKAQLTQAPPSTSYWVVHLRMTGQLLWVDQAEPLAKHTRVRLFFPENRELRFVDTRTFGQMWWVPPDRNLADIIPTLGKLGPEPFSEAFSEDYLADRLQASRRPIKTALLDQTLVAGVGNIYADEALFLSRIRPTTRCDRLSLPQITALRQAVIDVLEKSIGVGGTTFSDFRDVQGLNGNYGGQAWVYGREGEPCLVCGTALDRMRLAGRSSHFCPTCQT
jgi:formamidopyrimidine-DNA glycosylase